MTRIVPPKIGRLLFFHHIVKDSNDVQIRQALAEALFQSATRQRFVVDCCGPVEGTG
jgi:hypothetical protein